MSFNLVPSNPLRDHNKENLPRSGEEEGVLVGFEWLPHGEGLEMPQYATNLSAGMDLRAAVAEGDEGALTLAPHGGRELVPAGFTMRIPAGFEAQIRPRSGLALKDGVTVLNTPGTIDADYHGEIKIILVNFGDKPFTVTRGMRIAQMVIAPVVQVVWQDAMNVEGSLDQHAEASSLSPTRRGLGGFGSTGLD